jgi:pantoate--beta-alanine ligase
MQIVSSIAAMQRLAKKWRRAGIKIGFVPTMGYLHAGHLSLVKRARQAVGKNGKVVVSIYVNPTQFAPTEDLSKYPRDLKRDLKLLRELNTDVVFTPGDAEMYPNKSENGFSTYVVEEKLSRHGRRVAAHAFSRRDDGRRKTFQHRAAGRRVFGQKDFQQAAVIQRMVADLNFPLKIIVAPTHCAKRDGLAMSSRNKYLDGDLRAAGDDSLARDSGGKSGGEKSKTVLAAKLKADLKKLIESRAGRKIGLR